MIELRLPARVRARPDDPDPEAVRLVQETRLRVRGLTRRERWASLLVGGGFLAAAIPFATIHSSHRSPSAITLLALIVAYAIAYRVEFEVAAGSVVSTELVLVPMLFLLPLGIVPLVVAAAIVLARLPNYARGHAPIARVGADLVSSWHALGPALVLAVAGERGPSLSHWKLYVVALAAQFAVDFGAGTLYQLLAHGISPRAELRFIAAGFGVDAALAPIGLVAAIVAQEHALYFLLLLPLVALLAAFARQRRSAIDGAVALGSAYRGAAELLVDFVEDTDAYTGDHSRGIVELVLEVADELGMDARGRRDAELAALLHDVGKMRVPRELLTKPSSLTSGERALMETHTVEGEKILARVGGLLGDVGNIVRSCHERWDGFGYPDGLAEEEIPLVARIVACCDAYSAMTTDRPYRSALREQDALAELELHSGAQFDPQVVDALVRVLEREPALVA
jgi:HD-GYP domain-containing protein (c-di-GMP phosphodiesterase class II)